MGFEEDIKSILQILKEKVWQKQSVLISATLRGGIRQLATFMLQVARRVLYLLLYPSNQPEFGVMQGLRDLSRVVLDCVCVCRLQDPLFVFDGDASKEMPTSTAALAVKKRKAPSDGSDADEDLDDDAGDDEDDEDDDEDPQDGPEEGAQGSASFEALFAARQQEQVRLDMICCVCGVSLEI
jgi:hypothetical protein